jgi:hypothetical protein
MLVLIPIEWKIPRISQDVLRATSMAIFSIVEEENVFVELKELIESLPPINRFRQSEAVF